MKKTISLMLCLLLIFSSVSFAFAVDWSTTDSNNLQSIKNTLTNTTGGTIYYMISQINAAMRFSNKTIANWLSDIENHLATTLYQNDGNTSRSIAWWVKEAVLDLDQLVSSGNGTILNYLDNIYNRIVDIKTSTANIYTESHTIRTNIADLMVNYIPTIRDAISLYLPSIKTDTENIYNLQDYDGNLQYLKNLGNIPKINYNGSGNTNTPTFPLNSASIIGHILNFVLGINNSLVNYAVDTWNNFQHLTSGYNNTQTYTNWQSLSSASFNPTSTTNGLYNWLKNIQTPIARIAYVHASDEEIAAREKAAANQTAVVNNFIDSNGSGSVPASSFGSVASMSSGYTSNMNTDAQVSGIWNIFNSNNFGWFSQETVNQLDTSVSTRKGSSDFETPILDHQISEIYKELGVDVND